MALRTERRQPMAVMVGFFGGWVLSILGKKSRCSLPGLRGSVSERFWPVREN